MLLIPALAGSLAVIPLLFLRWFEARESFVVLFGALDRYTLHPTGWEAFGGEDVAIAVLAAITFVAALAAARGMFVAWTAGAAAAVAGAVVAYVARGNPPAPGGGTYTSGDIALAPTPAAAVVIACFLVAVLSLTAWAVVNRAD